MTRLRPLAGLRAAVIGLALALTAVSCGVEQGGVVARADVIEVRPAGGTATIDVLDNDLTGPDRSLTGIGEHPGHLLVIDYARSGLVAVRALRSAAGAEYVVPYGMRSGGVAGDGVLIVRVVDPTSPPPVIGPTTPSTPPSTPSTPSSTPSSTQRPATTAPPPTTPSSPTTVPTTPSTSGSTTSSSITASSTTVSIDPPVITGLVASDVGETSAQISFRTSTCTTARYVGSGLSHESPGWPDADARCWTSHSHRFTGLVPGSTYSVAVGVRDREAQTATATVTFTTVPRPDPPPVVTELRVSEINQTSAWVSFTTETCTTARYLGHGLLHESPGWPDANARCWTDHGHRFTGLTPGTTYTVAVQVRDRFGQAATGGPITFTTADPPPPPTITALVASDVDEASAQVSFRTNTCTTARYAGSGLLHESPGWPDANVQCWTDHGHDFTGLTSATTYTVSVEVRDRFGRTASATISFTTDYVIS